MIVNREVICFRTNCADIFAISESRGFMLDTKTAVCYSIYEIWSRIDDGIILLFFCIQIIWRYYYGNQTLCAVGTDQQLYDRRI